MPATLSNNPTSSANSPGLLERPLKRRCLVPAVAHYEWKALDGGKQSMAIAPASGEATVFAGIWENWRGEGDEVVRTFAIITTDTTNPCAPCTTGCR